MNREEIKKLAGIAFEKRERFNMLGMSHNPGGETGKEQYAEYEVARAEMLQAEADLTLARRSVCHGESSSDAPKVKNIEELKLQFAGANTLPVDQVTLNQYENLRTHFNMMVKDVLGKDYCNMGMDVYDADRICCEDITRKANRGLLGRLFQ